MRALGWKGEIKAIGVEKYAYSRIAKTVPIPNVVYNWSAPQLDQKNTPTCGPHSFVELYYTSMRQNGLEPVLLDPFDLSNSYRQYTGEIFTGVYNRIMMQVAAKVGVYCPADEKRYKIKAYHTVEMVQDEILNCLAEGYCFLVGFPVYQSFEDAEDGIVPMPGKGDEFLGGHDCLIQGFDLDKQVVYGQNHWAGWGFEGHSFVGACHFQMPMEYLTRLGSDAWTITLT